MRIVRTARAEEDLIEIWIYIARDNQRAADQILDELDKKTRILSVYPRAGRERPDIAPNVRSLVCGPYLILYGLEDDHVQIVRYVHGRRDLTEMI